MSARPRARGEAAAWMLAIGGGLLAAKDMLRRK